MYIVAPPVGSVRFGRERTWPKTTVAKGKEGRGHPLLVPHLPFLPVSPASATDDNKDGVIQWPAEEENVLLV